MNLESFVSYKEINHVKVNMPNGVCVNATHKGNIASNNGILLHNVLFILDFNYNLISISKLITNSHIHVIFTNLGALFRTK